MSKSPTTSLQRAGGEHRYRILVESVKDYAIFMLDRDGCVETWNAGASIIKGYAPHEIIGRRIDVFYSAEARAQGTPARLLARAREDGRAEDEGWRLRKDGSQFWADVVITAVRDTAGELVGYAKVTRDLTDVRTGQEALRHQQEELQRSEERFRLLVESAEEAVRVREQFLSIASHELRTPLTALKIDLYAIKEHLTAPDKLEKKVERATRNAERLGALIESLLNVSRMSGAKLNLRMEPMDLAQAVTEAGEQVRAAAVKAGCELLIESNGPVLGVWDRLQLDQVIMNLLANAIAFAPGHPITLSVRGDHNDAVLEVADRGPGIPQQDLDRIFGRFERASSRPHHGGLGLGLYVSREIVEALHGTIRGENRPGGGACFVVRLPVQPP